MRSSGKLYHLMTAQSVIAVKKVDIAYTSPSTAENHTDVENAVPKPATIPAKAKAICWPLSGSSLRPTKANFPNIIVIQQMNIAAKAVQMPDIKFTAKAISSGLLEIKSAT